jgi:carbon storage regulator
MLVVTRRKGQRIVIGNDIEVVVSGISGSTVKLAIIAPRSILVLRGEVFEAVCQLNQAALDVELDADFEMGPLRIEIEASGALESGHSVNGPIAATVSSLAETDV